MTYDHKERLDSMQRQVSNELNKLIIAYPDKKVMWHHLERAENELTELRIYLFNLNRFSGTI